MDVRRRESRHACVRLTGWLFLTKKTLWGSHSLLLTSSNWQRASICQHICFSRTLLSVRENVTDSFSWCSVDLSNNKSRNILNCLLFCLYVEIKVPPCSSSSWVTALHTLHTALQHAIHKVLFLLTYTSFLHCICFAFLHGFPFFPDILTLLKESLDSQSSAVPEPEYHLSSVSRHLRGDKCWEVPRRPALQLHSRLRFGSSFICLFSPATRSIL